MGDRSRTPYALLTRHFLRRFLENDLISPDADRSQLLAIVGAMVMSLTLFLSVMDSLTYVAPQLTPGQAAVFSLGDKFFYLALGMIVTALVAASQWDALAIDPHDAAILEPLPVPTGTIWRAKVSAVAILGAAVAIGVNAFPSVVFPWLLVFNFPQLPFVAMLGLMVTHAMVSIVAAAFGYLVVIALRETMVAVLGQRAFTRVSPWAQGLLVVLLGGSLLLLPAATRGLAQPGFGDWRMNTPPMWFLGAYEIIAGDVIADLPRRQMRPRQAENDRRASAVYDARRAQFPTLARRAGTAVIATVVLAVLAYTWNARRVATLAPAPPPAFRRRWRLGARLANALLLRDPSARAGFYFTLAAMWRSNTQRLTLACAAAAGLAMAVVAFSSANLTQGNGAPPRLLAAQPLFYGALLVGFRHAIRVPAELRANWGFQLAWRDRQRAFVNGVKHAAMVALILPALAALLPLFAFVLGLERALLHAGLGLAGGIVLLEALMCNYDKVPFTCTYVPSDNMKALAPIYLIAFVAGASSFARMQHEALYGTGAARAALTLVVAFAILRLISIKRVRLPHVDFDEAPVTVQRLRLDA